MHTSIAGNYDRFRAPTVAEERAQAEQAAEYASRVEACAEAVRRSMDDMDLGEVLMGEDALVEMVREGKLDDAGREFARLIAAYCTRCGERAAEV